MKRRIDNNRSIARIATAALALSAAAMGFSQNSTAVVPFGVSATSGAALRGMGQQALREFGNALSSMVESYLIEKGTALVNRSYLDKVIGEQVRNNSAPFDQTTATDIGKLVGARYIVVGQVTDMDLRSEKILVVTNLKASISATVSIIDTTTGTTIGGCVQTGSKTQTSFDIEKLLKIIDSNGNLNRVRDTRNAELYWGSVPGLGDAARSLAKKLAEKMSALLPKGAPMVAPAAITTISGMVLDTLSATEFIIDTKGMGALQPGNKVTVNRVSKEVRDENGTVKYQVMEEAGTGTVLDVQGSACRVRIDAPGKGALKTQDQVTLAAAK